VEEVWEEVVEGWEEVEVEAMYQQVRKAK